MLRGPTTFKTKARENDDICLFLTLSLFSLWLDLLAGKGQHIKNLVDGVVFFDFHHSNSNGLMELSFHILKSILPSLVHC